MYTGNKSSIVGVWVFTYYSDGKLGVTQTVPDKSQFDATKKGMATIGKWVRDNLKIGHKCPYSPNNPRVVNDDDKDIDDTGTMQDKVKDANG